MLSGLEQVHDPILVSAAHCNSVCRDADTQQPIEICCCLQTSDAGSCQEVRELYKKIYFASDRTTKVRVHPSPPYTLVVHIFLSIISFDEKSFFLSVVQGV